MHHQYSFKIRFLVLKISCTDLEHLPFIWAVSVRLFSVVKCASLYKDYIYNFDFIRQSTVMFFICRTIIQNSHLFLTLHQMLG